MGQTFLTAIGWDIQAKKRLFIIRRCVVSVPRIETLFLSQREFSLFIERFVCFQTSSSNIYLPGNSSYQTGVPSDRKSEDSSTYKSVHGCS